MRNNNEFYKGGFGQYGSRYKFKFLKSINVGYWLRKAQTNTQLGSMSGLWSVPRSVIEGL